MKKLYIMLAVCVMATLVNYSQTCLWAEKIAGNGNVKYGFISTDSYNNVYVTGTFESDSIVFNNGKILTNDGEWDAYIAKYNSSGICIWAEKIAGIKSDYSNRIDIDNKGNVYVIGRFNSQNLIANNGKSISNIGGWDSYLAKFNNNGVCQWIEKVASTNHDYGNDIAIDNNGNIFVTGTWLGNSSLTFNNGLTLSNTSTTEDIFIAKYDSSGTCLWAEKVASAKYDYVSSIAINNNGDVYLIGNWLGNSTLVFNNDKVLSNTSIYYDAYIAKYNRSGVCQWVEKIVGDNDEVANSIAIDDFGNLFIVGWWRGNSILTFNNYKTMTNTSIYSYIFITKYNDNGVCQWVEKISGDYGVNINSISLDCKSNIYIAGFWRNNSKILFNNNKSLTNSTEYNDIFIANYDSNGVCLWTEKISSSNNDYSNSAVSDCDGNIYVSGFWFGNSILSFNNNINLLNSKENFTDSFLAKYSFYTLISPNLSSPSNNATNQATNVTVSWSAVSSATSYKLQISKNSGFTTTVVDASNLTSTSYANTTLERSTTYYWRAKAVNAGGESNWSSVWQFTTMASEPVPDTWDFTGETGNNATVIVYTTIEPKIDNRDFQTGDAIGAFFTRNGNLVCAGYEVWNGENLALTVWGNDDQTETKDGFDVNEAYTFKIWDGQLGRELNAEFTVTSGQSKYTNNGITVLGSLNGVSTTTFNLPLKAGWNIISSYITTQNDSLKVMMTDVKTNINIMKNSAGKVYMPSANIDQIYRWDITQGYQIHMLAADKLPITGMKVNPTETPIIFSTTGWKISSYLRSSAMNIADCMGTLTDRNSLTIAKNNAGKIYLPPSINTIGNMISGEGYQMYINKLDTLVYPANSAGRSANTNEIQDFDARIIKTDFENTGNNSSLILDIDLPENTEIAVMNNDNKIVGAGRVVDGRTAIVIWGDDESTNAIDGSIDNYELRIMNYDAENGNYIEINNLDLTDVITGAKYNKLTYNKDAVLIGKALTQPISLKVNPNPFSSSTEVVYTLADDCEIELSLYNLSGMKVLDIANGKQNKGTHKLSINAENLSSGTYNVILKSCGKSVVEKVVIIK